MERLLVIVLAGGEGQRLYPLTKERSKPAVPFGGGYRIIDFTLSNCINSGVRKIYILTQYWSDSLNKHIQEGWGISSSGLGDYIYCVPPQQKVGRDWYQGTADALRQNLNLIKGKGFDNILILSGDHIYKMDYRQILDYHRKQGADLTLSAIRVRKDLAAGTFGVLEVDPNSKLVGFEEKPVNPKTIPDEPWQTFASMGIYIFKTDTLVESLRNSGDDFGREIIPCTIKSKNVYVYDYDKNNSIEDFAVVVNDGKRESVLVDRIRDSSYWKDVGTIDAYYQASMELVGVDPALNLYGQKWPFRTYHRKVPPCKFIIGGMAQESIVSEGCIISGGFVWHSILSPSVIVEKNAAVSDSILFDNVTIEPSAQVKRAIIDKGAIVKSGAFLGHDLEADKQRGCTISENGIVVVPKGTEIWPAT